MYAIRSYYVGGFFSGCFLRDRHRGTVFHFVGNGVGIPGVITSYSIHYTKLYEKLEAGSSVEDELALLKAAANKE